MYKGIFESWDLFFRFIISKIPLENVLPVRTFMGKDVPFTSLNQEKQQLNYSFKRSLFTRHVILITENEFIKIFIKNDSRVFTVYFTFFLSELCFSFTFKRCMDNRCTS